jgi:hypothetical protein
MHLMKYLRSNRNEDRFIAEFSLLMLNCPAPGIHDALLHAMGVRDDSVRVTDESGNLAA